MLTNMFERTQSNRLQFIYTQSKDGRIGENEKMLVTFNNKNRLKPIINVGGSIYEGKVATVESHSGNKKRHFLKIMFENDKLPIGVENKNISFDLAEYFPVAIGFLGLYFPFIMPILSSEHLKIKINQIEPVSRSLRAKYDGTVRVEDTQVKIMLSKEKKFTIAEKKLIRELIAQLEKENTTAKR